MLIHVIMFCGGKTQSNTTSSSYVLFFNRITEHIGINDTHNSWWQTVVDSDGKVMPFDTYAKFVFKMYSTKPKNKDAFGNYAFHL